MNKADKKFMISILDDLISYEIDKDYLLRYQQVKIRLEKSLRKKS